MRICPECRAVFNGLETHCPHDQTMLVEIDDSAPTRQVPTHDAIHRLQSMEGSDSRYTIVQRLGQGGWGTVYKAYHHATRRMVGLKILRSEIAQDTEARRRFHKEVEAISKLRHPNTVTLFDFGENADGLLFMAMEFVDGRRLDHLIKEEGPLEPAIAVHIARQMALALSEAHDYGIVHRDVKPQNTLLTQIAGDDHFVKVLDFGVARFVSEETGITSTGTTFGTPEYMSPEQVQSNQVDHRADLYALGIILYEMLAGHVPFSGGDAITVALAHAHKAPPEFETKYDLPKELLRLLNGLLAKNPDDRPASATEVVDELTRIQAELELNKAPPGDRERTYKVAYSSSLWRNGAIALVLMVLVATGLVFLRNHLTKEELTTPAEGAVAANPGSMPSRSGPGVLPGDANGEKGKTTQNEGASFPEAEVAVVAAPSPHLPADAMEEEKRLNGLVAEARKALHGPSRVPVDPPLEPPAVKKSTDPLPEGATEGSAETPTNHGGGSSTALEAASAPVIITKDVHSNVPLAEVWWGGRRRCTTPCRVNGKEGTSRRLTLKKEGYEPAHAILRFNRSGGVLKARLQEKPLSEQDGLKGGGAPSTKDGLK